MARRRSIHAAALAAVLLLPGLLVPSASALASPAAATACATPWQPYENWIGQFDSPEFPSASGIDFSRTVQFKVSGGDFAQRTNESCQPEKAAFGAATLFRQKQCGNFQSCSYTDWTSYGNDAERANYRFPGRNVGWDPYYRQFRTWDLPVRAR